LQLREASAEPISPIRAAETDGDTALDHAVYRQNLDSIGVLLAAGATSNRARDHALKCLAKVELEAERQHAYEEFYTPVERRRSLANREATIAEMKAKFPEHDWARNPFEEALTRAREVLARIEGVQSTSSLVWPRSGRVRRTSISRGLSFATRTGRLHTIRANERPPRSN
jgi:hypothetical protein